MIGVRTLQVIIAVDKVMKNKLLLIKKMQYEKNISNMKKKI